MQTDTSTLQTILPQGDAVYARHHRLPDDTRRAVWAMRACRPAVLGGHVPACPAGQVERIWDNSCRHRLCPPWAWGQIDRWLVQQQARRLACEHDHVLCTIPHELNEVCLANGAVMSRRLFARVHDTRVELLGDAHYLGARPGLMATRPPWSQTWLLPPPIHCLVSGGGMHEAGHGVAVRTGDRLPRRVVMALFRGKRLAALRQRLAQGTRQRPPGKRRQPVEHRRNKLGRQTWPGQIRARYPHGHGVLISLARYLRGGPIAPRRLVSCDGQQVVLRDAERAKPNGGQPHQRTMRLPLEQCRGRGRWHVPPARAVRVRCGGLYAHTQGEALARCRQQLGQGPVQPPEPLDGVREGATGGEAHPDGCPVCGQRRVGTALLPRAGAPPPAETEWEQVA